MTGSRAALQCAALLVLVLGVTLGASWTTWQHLVDQRVRLSAPQTPAPAPTADIVDHDAGRSSITSAPQRGSTIEKQPAARTPGHRSSPTGRAVTVAGPQLAAGPVTATLVVGLGLSLWVHRRYRRILRERARAAAAGILRQPAQDAPTPAGKVQSTGRPHVGSGAAAAAPRSPRPAASRPPSPGPSPAASPAPAHAPSRAPSHTPEDLRAEPQPRDAHRRVLVDRRAHDRVPYERAARLHLRGVQREVTTVDLSEIGVRIHLQPSDAEALPVSLQVGEWVDVVLPVGDDEVQLRAEVKNVASRDTGTDIGLEFKNLPDYQRQRLRAAVMSLRLWGSSAL